MSGCIPRRCVRYQTGRRYPIGLPNSLFICRKADAVASRIRQLSHHTGVIVCVGSRSRTCRLFKAPATMASAWQSHAARHSQCSSSVTPKNTSRRLSFSLRSLLNGPVGPLSPPTHTPCGPPPNHAKTLSAPDHDPATSPSRAAIEPHRKHQTATRPWPRNLGLWLATH